MSSKCDFWQLVVKAVVQQWSLLHSLRSCKGPSVPVLKYHKARKLMGCLSNSGIWRKTMKRNPTGCEVQASTRCTFQCRVLYFCLATSALYYLGISPVFFPLPYTSTEPKGWRFPCGLGSRWIHCLEGRENPTTTQVSCGLNGTSLCPNIDFTKSAWSKVVNKTLELFLWMDCNTYV